MPEISETSSFAISSKLTESAQTVASLEEPATEPIVRLPNRSLRSQAPAKVWAVEGLTQKARARLQRRNEIVDASGLEVVWVVSARLACLPDGGRVVVRLPRGCQEEMRCDCAEGGDGHLRRMLRSEGIQWEEADEGK